MSARSTCSNLVNDYGYQSSNRLIPTYGIIPSIWADFDGMLDGKRGGDFWPKVAPHPSSAAQPLISPATSSSSTTYSSPYSNASSGTTAASSSPSTHIHDEKKDNNLVTVTIPTPTIPSPNRPHYPYVYLRRDPCEALRVDELLAMQDSDRSERLFADHHRRVWERFCRRYGHRIHYLASETPQPRTAELAEVLGDDLGGAVAHLDVIGAPVRAPTALQFPPQDEGFVGGLQLYLGGSSQNMREALGCGSLEVGYWSAGGAKSGWM